MMKLAEIATSRVYRSFAWSSAIMVLVMITGTVGYHIIGGPQYTWIDCFYMTFITIATIGFGEVVDLSNSSTGRLFTVFIAFLGIGTMTYMLSTLTAFILEGDINEAWRRRKMQNKIAKLKDHYIVCGIGRVGSNVAHELAMTGRPCVIVDPNFNTLRAIWPCIRNSYICMVTPPTMTSCLRLASNARAGYLQWQRTTARIW